MRLLPGDQLLVGGTAGEIRSVTSVSFNRVQSLDTTDMVKSYSTLRPSFALLLVLTDHSAGAPDVKYAT